MSEAKHQISTSRLRIIGGRWRSRKLVIPSRGVRPTGDRVKETLFNWLQKDILGAHCLDLFAGTGYPGIESISRGADSVVFVENNKIVANLLHQNLKNFKCSNYKLLRANALKIDLSKYGPFDLVFLDPPFGRINIGNLFEMLENSNCLANSALVYMEAPIGQPLMALPSGWEIFREQKAGKVSLVLLERQCIDS